MLNATESSDSAIFRFGEKSICPLKEARQFLEAMGDTILLHYVLFAIFLRDVKYI